MWILFTTIMFVKIMTAYKYSWCILNVFDALLNLILAPWFSQIFYFFTDFSNILDTWWIIFKPKRQLYNRQLAKFIFSDLKSLIYMTLLPLFNLRTNYLPPPSICGKGLSLHSCLALFQYWRKVWLNPLLFKNRGKKRSSLFEPRIQHQCHCEIMSQIAEGQENTEWNSLPHLYGCEKVQ